MQRVLIVGATSAIAQATARLFAERGDRLLLLARDGERLVAIASDLESRGAQAVTWELLDVDDIERHREVLGAAETTLEGIDIALIAHGVAPDQEACEREFSATAAAFHTNTLSTLSLVTELAARFAARRGGALAVISSVAGDRGRPSNYVYGTTKGAVSLFLQGLRGRLHPRGVHVLTIKPGYVDTPMTEHHRKGFLWAQPDRVARDIAKAIEKKRNVLYTPWFWRPIMALVKLIPEAVGKRLRF